MARDDYFVIACRILLYLYDCLKMGERANTDFVCSYQLGIPESYLEYILRHLFANGYIEGGFASIFGRSKEMLDLMITPKGIEFLQENSAMNKAREFLKSLKEIVPGI